MAQICDGSRGLAHCLVEAEDYLLRLDTDGAGVGNRRDELWWRNIDWSTGRNAGRGASRHEQRDADEPPQSAFTFSASCSRRLIHSSSFVRSAATTFAGALL